MVHAPFRATCLILFSFWLQNPDTPSPPPTPLYWSTYFGGGTLYENADRILIDTEGKIFGKGFVVLAGYTWSDTNTFPITPNAYDTTFNGGTDIFIAVFDPTQTGPAQLVYSSYLGGSGNDYPAEMEITEEGELLLIGTTSSADIPTTTGQTPAGANDAFLARLDLNLSGSNQLTYGTTFGGSDSEYLGGMYRHGSRLWFAGQTRSDDLPVTPGALGTTHQGIYDGFFAAVNLEDPTRHQLEYASYWGGSEWDFITHAGGYADRLVLYGETGSDADFPITPGAFDSSWNGGWDLFVTVLDLGAAEGKPAKISFPRLLYSTYAGGSGNDQAEEMAVDPGGRIVLAGSTDSRDFPVTSQALDSTLDGPCDAFVMDLAPNLDDQNPIEQLRYSTYLGGSEEDLALGLDLDSYGNIYLTGDTISQDFPTTRCAFLRDVDDIPGVTPVDIYVARIDPTLPPEEQLTYSTLHGGGSFEDGYSIDVDETTGRFAVSGNTRSGRDDPTRPFPTSTGAIFPDFIGGQYDDVASILVPSWANYGAGQEGSLGIPGLTFSVQDGSAQVHLRLENSSGQDSSALLLIGSKPDSGDLLVSPDWVLPLTLPAGGGEFSFPLEIDVEFYLQTLQADPGARGGISFSPGLRINLSGDC